MMRRACGPLAPLLDAMTPFTCRQDSFRREAKYTRLVSLHHSTGSFGGKLQSSHSVTSSFVSSVALNLYMHVL